MSSGYAGPDNSLHLKNNEMLIIGTETSDIFTDLING